MLLNGKSACTLKIRGVRHGCLRQESWKGCADSMGEERNSGREPRSDPVRVVYGIDQQGGKGGANYLKEVCQTILSDSHGTPHAVACIGVDLYNQALTGGVSKTLNNRATDSDHVPCILVYESHNQDSRYNPLGEICETVSAKYGTGGGNQPIVLRYEESLCGEEIL